MANLGHAMIKTGHPMDLEEFRAFLALAESGSFLTAAQTLHQSRATLRRRIDQLEARAGVPLVDRTRMGVTLTGAGAVLAARGRLHVLQGGRRLAAGAGAAGAGAEAGAGEPADAPPRSDRGTPQ